MTKTVSLIVSGKVQGVFYRQSTKEFANSIGLTGEVRNMPDDTVAIIATGSEEQIEKLVKWCHQGPPKAMVTNVTVTEIAKQTFEKFRIAR